ncbi:MAG: biliverdin-producing heme oxygenase [Verrucomicrobia bacterium]|nr:biliverdin-producing heme oxygenase [Verrucomicrobiota bacterium]
MKPGLFGQQLTVMEELKAATFVAHGRLQTAPFFQALAACQLPLESYVGQLRALSVIHGVLEQALAACADERVASVWNNDMRKLPLLQQDLRYFEPRAVADLKEAGEAALKATEQLRLRSVDQPLTLLGSLYVVEGSTLGVQVLRPIYARAFLLAGEEGLAYLRPYGAAVHARWAQYQQRMNALRLSAAEREQLAQAANELFDQLAAVFQALYPFQPESKTFLITSINPEAGRHPVPADAREVQAALRAADLCWQRFPYFEHRYGERGRRFARSDAAWLATLVHYEPAQILQQVQWLGRVLAGRGMPTLLLQVQLELLVQELSTAIPAKQSDYEKLSPAAVALHDSRRKHLADDQLHALTAGFDHAVGPEWSGKFPHTGALLAAGVADELAGNAGAVETLRSWMTDATRFPATWIAAVQTSLAQAQEHVRP